MTKKNEDIFNKITSIEERRKLFGDMANSKTEIFCKSENEEVFKLICERYSSEGKMICSLAKADKTEPKILTSLVCQFDLGGEKYFFKSTLDFRIKNYVLDLTDEIFHLQRRQSYRIRIPLSTKSIADVVITGTNQTIKAIPVDLSTGGCRISITQPGLKFEIGNEIKLYLKIGAREPIALTGLIRHIRQETTPKITTYIGIQFSNVSTQTEKTLFSITMDLYREFFARVES